jgi:hypothetical protein
MSDIQESYSQLRGDPRWELTQRVAQSETFKRSPRLRAFLLFVVSQTLEDAGEELNEYQIGTHVFERPASFNPAEESIVRSSARQLRSKLQEYFDGEGRAENQVLTIPKGSYVPEFAPRTQGAPESTGRGGRILVWQTATAVLAVACLALIWVALRPPKTHSPLTGTLVSAVFAPSPVGINVVLCDSALAVVNGLRPDLLGIEEYAKRAEQTPLPQLGALPGGAAPAQFPGGRLITSFRDAAFMASLTERGAQAGYRFMARHSRLVNSRDFRSGDHILLGSSWSNPWSEIFEVGLNFRFERDADGRFGIRNRTPLPGEDAFYFSSAEQGHSGVSPARVVLAPNLSGTGRVLLISGLHTESSEGATEAALSPDFLKSVERLAGGRRLEAMKRFELLVKIRSADGTVQSHELVAGRFP